MRRRSSPAIAATSSPGRLSGSPPHEAGGRRLERGALGPGGEPGDHGAHARGELELLVVFALVGTLPSLTAPG